MAPARARAGHPPAAKSTCHAPPHTAPRGRTTRQTPAPHVPPLPRRAAGPRTRGQTRPAARRAHSTWPRMLLDGAHGRSARARASRIVRRRVPRCPAVGPACRRPCFHAAAASPDQPPSPTTPMPTPASGARRPSRVRGESRDGGGASSSPRVVVRLARDRAAAEGRSPVGILPCPDGVAPLPPLRVALRPLSACAGSGAPRELPARPLPRGLTAQPAPPRPPLLPPPAPYPASRPG